MSDGKQNTSHENAIGWLILAVVFLALAMLFWYFFLTAKLRSPPVPYWFPATVGVGMAGIAGSKVGMEPVLQQIFFWISATLYALAKAE